MYELLGRLSPDGSFGKTSPEFCHRTGDEPLEPSSGRWMNSGMGWRGEFLTLSSSEWPSDAAVSFLSDVLEAGGGASAVLFEPESVPGNTQTSKQKRQALAADAGRGPAGASGCLSAAAYSLQTGHTRANGSGVNDTGVRVFAEDGCGPTLPSGGTEGMTIQPVVMAHTHSHAEIGERGVVPTLTAHNQKDAPVLATGPTCSQHSAQPMATSSSSTTRASAAGGSSSSRAIAMADDNAKTAVDVEMCGSLKVGGAPPMVAFPLTETT